MKRVLIVVVVGIVVLAGAWGAWSLVGQGQGAGQAGGKATPSPEPAENVIWASGKLVPVQWAGLSPATSGTVRAIHVAEGDRVEAGKVLLELDNAALQRQVDVAAAAVAEAQAARDRLLAGATAEQIAQAEAEAGSAEAAVAVAEAGVKQAQQAAAAARSQVAIAQAQYNELASRPNEAEKISALRQVDVAQAAVKQAQTAYDRVKGAADIGLRPESLALEQATIQLQSAKAAYDASARGATPQQLAVAAAQIQAGQNQAQVAASQVPSAEAGVQAAQAQLARARAALAALKAGPTSEERAIAESRIKSAQAQQASAQAQLAQTQVTAPFPGQVGSIQVRPGELAVPGQPVLMLGDTTRLRVETTDLRETDVARVALNQPAEITFDALPRRTFSGTITRIAPMSTAEKGSTNYTLVVELPELDPALRWGMTAFVSIQGQ